MTTGMQQTAETIAIYARTAMSLMQVDMNTALDEALNFYLRDAHEARTRGGRWARESTTDDIEETLFLGSVARDALDNTARPSTGPMRDYILRLI